MIMDEIKDLRFSSYRGSYSLLFLLQMVYILAMYSLFMYGLSQGELVLAIIGICGVIVGCITVYLQMITPTRIEKIGDKKKILEEILKTLREWNSVYPSIGRFKISFLKRDGGISIDFNYKNVEEIFQYLKKYPAITTTWEVSKKLTKDINRIFINLKKKISDRIHASEKDKKKILEASGELLKIILKKPIEDCNSDKLGETIHMDKIQFIYDDEVIDDFLPNIVKKYEIKKFLSEIIDDEIKAKLKEIYTKKELIDGYFVTLKKNLEELLSLPTWRLIKSLGI